MSSGQMAEHYSETKAFQVFAAMCWEQHKSRHPAANIDPNRFAEISTGRWKAMTQEQKNAFYYKHEEEEAQKARQLKRKNSQGAKNEPKSKKPCSSNDEEKPVKEAVKPKPMKSASSFYISEIRSEFRKQNPDMNLSKANGELLSKWEVLSDQEKKKYQEMALKDQIRYETELKSYEATLTSSSKETKDPKKPRPKKPAFNFFSLEKSTEIRKKNPTLKPNEITKEITELWQALDEEAKQKYNKMALQDQLRYEEEFRLYQQLQPQKVVYQVAKDPNKPKKGRNAFMFFNGEINLLIRKDNPTFTTGEIAKEIGNRWQNLTDDEKKKYQDMADKDKARHEEEMKTYEAPPPIMTPIKNIKDPNKPKGAKNAYSFFGSEVTPQMRLESPNMTFAEASKELGKRWKEADDATRKKYEDMAIADKERYETEMKGYKPPPQGKVVKKQKDPNKPKGKTHSYMFFSIETAPLVRKEFPEMPTTEVAKTVGSRWKELSEEARKKYEAMAEKDKIRYDEEMELYKDGKFVLTASNDDSSINPDSEATADITETEVCK